MSTTDIAAAFKDFEDKYNLPPVFQMSDGKIMSAFIITKKGESFLISFETSDAEIIEAAKFVSEDRIAEAEQDIRKLKAFCSAPALRTPAPETLQ